MFKPALQNSFRAALMITAASSLIGMTAILAKILGQGFKGESLHPLQVSAGRFGFALLTILIFLLIKRYKFEKPHYLIHFSRSVFGWIGVTCMFAAVTLIPVPDAISISFLNPVFAMFLALLILKERVGALRWSAAGIALAGSIILLRPGFDGFQLGALNSIRSCIMLWNRSNSYQKTVWNGGPPTDPLHKQYHRVCNIVNCSIIRLGQPN